MLDFILLDHPLIFPFACVCGNQRGPILDTHYEIAGSRIYLCQRCVKSGARILGFSSGERLDELEAASESVLEKERENAGLLEQLGEYVLQVQARDGHIRDLKDSNEQLAARVSQLTTSLRESNEMAQAHMSLVGAGNEAA